MSDPPSRSPLTREHAERLRAHGFAVVPDFLTGAELEAVRRDLPHLTPSAEEVRREPERYDNGQARSWFPFESDALNDIVVRPDVIDWCAGAIGTASLVMTDALLLSKYGGLRDFDQPLHQDFLNNDLAYPRRDGGFLQVTTILYLTDVGPDDGPTAVVDRERYGQEVRQDLGHRAGGHPLYAHEVPVTCRAGTLFVYDTLTYHRGTSMSAPDGVRHVLFFQYGNAAHRWIGKHAYGHLGIAPAMRRFMTRAAPRQREVIGFPPVGGDYWNEETLAGVARRYPEMDMAPYREAMAARSRHESASVAGSVPSG